MLVKSRDGKLPEPNSHRDPIKYVDLELRKLRGREMKFVTQLNKQSTDIENLQAAIAQLQKRLTEK